MHVVDCLSRGIGPAEAGRVLASAHVEAERTGRDRPGLLASAWAKVAAARAPCLRYVPAMSSVAAATEAWGGHPYHSAAHHAEVASNAMALASMSGLQDSPDGCRLACLLAVAALGHDLGYDPRDRHPVPFGREIASAAGVDRICAAAGLDAPDREAVSLMILATWPMARDDLRTMGGGGTIGRAHRLGRLLSAPGILGAALLLSDADLLSSSGLTAARARCLETRLGEELGHPVSHGERLFFFDSIVGPGYVSRAGSFFDSNVAAVRSAVLAGQTCPDTYSSSPPRPRWGNGEE